MDKISYIICGAKWKVGMWVLSLKLWRILIQWQQDVKPSRVTSQCRPDHRAGRPTLIWGVWRFYSESSKPCASLVAQTVNNMPGMWETRFDSCVGKISWIRKWQPTLIFSPGKVHGKRSLAEHSPQSRVRHDWMTNTFTFKPIKVSCSTCIRVLTIKLYFSGMWT